MKVLYFDCFSGISGDMTVGALCDLGVKPSTLEWELSKLDLGDFHMHFEREKRAEIEGVKFGIHAGATHSETCEHDHGHDCCDSHEHSMFARERAEYPARPASVPRAHTCRNFTVPGCPVATHGERPHPW